MQVSEISHHATLGKSDHAVITFKNHCYIDYANPKQRFLFDKANWQSMEKTLQLTDFSKQFELISASKSVNELWKSLEFLLLNLE